MIKILSLLILLIGTLSLTNVSKIDGNTFVENVGVNEDSLVKLLPNASTVVVDLENLFSVKQEAKLTKTILKFKKKTTIEVAIISVENFYPYQNIDDYSLALFNKWGIGNAKTNNGILIIVSKKQRIVRISTGTGLIITLTDADTKKINDNEMIPYFKKGDFYGGVFAGLKAIIDFLK